MICFYPFIFISFVHIALSCSSVVGDSSEESRTSSSGN